MLYRVNCDFRAQGRAPLQETIDIEAVTGSDATELAQHQMAARFKPDWPGQMFVVFVRGVMPTPVGSDYIEPNLKAAAPQPQAPTEPKIHQWDIGYLIANGDGKMRLLRIDATNSETATDKAVPELTKTFPNRGFRIYQFNMISLASLEEAAGPDSDEAVAEHTRRRNHTARLDQKKSGARAEAERIAKALDNQEGEAA